MILPRRLLVAPLLLTLLLTAGPIAAAAHRPQVWQPRLSVTGLLSEAWAFLSWAWECAGGSTDLIEKAGGSIDPFGKAGSGIDPFGKSGSSIDPFGNPAPNSQPHADNSSATVPPASGN